MPALETIFSIIKQYQWLIFLSLWIWLILANAVIYRRDRKLLKHKTHSPSPPPLHTWPALPKVSFLVPAWNESKNIVPFISSYTNLKYPNKELVLCAGGQDDTYAQAMAYCGPDIKVIEQKAGEGKQRSLERSLASSNGEIIYLTDADCRIDDACMAALVYPIINHSAVAVSGITRPLEQQIANKFIRNQWAPRFYLNIKNNSQLANGINGANSALNRAVVEEAWRNSTEIVSGTDYYLTLNLSQKGITIQLSPESVIQTYFPERVGHYIRQQRRWLKNLFLLGMQYRDVASFRHAIITIGIGWFYVSIQILPLLLSLPGLFLWALAWFAIILSRWHYLSVLDRAIKPSTSSFSIETFITLVSDILAWSSVPFYAFIPTLRKKW